MGRIAPRFARVEPRRRAREFVLGLLSGLPRKNCWTLAAYAGDATPDGLQHLLSRAKWDTDAVRDDLRGFVIEQLHDTDAVLVVDETGDLKKGTHTVGVQRQYTGTAGRSLDQAPSCVVRLTAVRAFGFQIDPMLGAGEDDGQVPELEPWPAVQLLGRCAVARQAGGAEAGRTDIESCVWSHQAPWSGQGRAIGG